jgi:hypothetical protein
MLILTRELLAVSVEGVVGEAPLVPAGTDGVVEPVGTDAGVGTVVDAAP